MGGKMLEHMNESHAEVTHWGIDFLELGDNDNVLDIGCGGGAALSYMADKVTSGHLTGIDYSPVSVEMSKEFNKENIADGKMDIVGGSVEKLPFGDESFDKIITVERFYFWPDPAENLKEVCRVTKKGGSFAIIADIYGSSELKQSDLENIEKYHMFNPGAEEFERMLKEAGFSDARIHLNPRTTWICAQGIK